ncbi:MAG: phage portal protein, partial [Enterobacteriaceae bacterium]
MDKVQILDQFGKPLTAQRPALSMLNGSSAPYSSADVRGDHMADWNPWLGSPDSEINIHRDRMVSRIRDLARNDGWASGAITRILDNAVGAVFRPLLKPDYRALAAISGNSAFDADWADEYGSVVEAFFRTWSTGPGRYCDLERKLTVSQMMRLAFRHKLVDGDALAVLHYRTDRLGVGRAKYATTVQLVDPDRLSNPQGMMDLRYMRGGVEIDDDGAHIAYHIRKAHMGDWWSGADTATWERVPRETAWGRPIVVHDYDFERASQHRGVGILSPIVQRLKMLTKYDASELDAAIINAIFGAYIESPFDPKMVEDSLGTSVDEISAYQAERISYHSDKRLRISGVGLTHLFPGEQINTVTAARPSSNFKDFESAVLRNVAAGTGISAQQLTQDWSDVNYSSARAAMLEAWKTLTRRRTDFATGFAQPILAAFIEELHSVEKLPLPAGAPDFIDCRTEYTRANWMGPGRGWV